MNRRLLWGAILLVSIAGSAGVRADQNDPQLGVLFQQLKAAPTSKSAADIEHRIWAIWLESGNPEIDKFLQDGEAAMSAGDFDAALSDFNTVIARKPKFAEGWNRRATLDYLMGEYQKSLADIDRTLALEPRHFGALSGLGLVDLKLDRTEAAADAFKRVLAIDPQNQAARENLDILNMVLKRKSI